MDIYVVLGPGGRFIAASAKLQGAELLRSNAADRIADRILRNRFGPLNDAEARASDAWKTEQKIAYDGMTIEDADLQDVE